MIRFLAAVMQSWFGTPRVVEIDSAQLIQALKRSGYKPTFKYPRQEKSL